MIIKSHMNTRRKVKTRRRLILKVGSDYSTGQEVSSLSNDDKKKSQKLQLDR